jgi:ABC-2 type transport system ATP-binding protein
MVTEHVIETHHLRKVFDASTAIADLNLDINRGEVFGFLGPNGAGKTTAVKMLLGLVAPTSGEGRLFGFPLGSPVGRTHAGYLPEYFRFHDWLKAGEFLQLHANLCKISPAISRNRIPELLELVDLKGCEEKKLRTFSKGMLQRIGLAQALINEPTLVFLDEPTSGLDPQGRRLVRDIIRSLRDRGTTVFLNSHLLSEVEVTCDRVAFVKQGKIVYERSMQALIEGETVVRIEVRPGVEENQNARVWASVTAGLLQWGSDVRVDGDVIHLTVADFSVIPHITRYLIAQQVDVFAISPHRMALEDIFMQVMERGAVA